MAKGKLPAHPAKQERIAKAASGPHIADPKAAAAFHRSVNLLHWQAYFQDDCDGPLDLGPATLAQLSGAERRLVADAAADLLSGRFTFAEAHAVWLSAENDTMSIRWHDADSFRDFLLRLRDTIDPFAWPVVKPGFRPNTEPAAR